MAPLATPQWRLIPPPSERHPDGSRLFLCFSRFALLPPLAVAVRFVLLASWRSNRTDFLVQLTVGCGVDVLINICLTLLGVLPGHLHAWYILYKDDQARKRYGEGYYTYRGSGQFVPTTAAPGYVPVPAGGYVRAPTQY